MGALTITVNRRGIVGDLRWAWGHFAFSTSYATGGDTGLTAAALGWDRVVMMNLDQPAGYTLEYNYTSGLVLAYRIAAVTDASHGTHQHNITTVGAAGGGTAMLTPMVAGALEGGAQVNTNAVDASAALTHTATVQTALAEVTAAVNLSAVTSAGNVNLAGAAVTAVRFLAFGH